jgi:hypothetical protein
MDCIPYFLRRTIQRNWHNSTPYQHSTSFRSFLTKILIQQKENNDPAKSINNRRRKPSNGSRVQDKQEVLDSNDLFYRPDVTLAVPTLNNNGNINKLLFRPIHRHRHHPKQRSSAVNAIHRFRLYVLPTPPPGSSLIRRLLDLWYVTNGRCYRNKRWRRGWQRWAGVLLLQAAFQKLTVGTSTTVHRVPNR